MPLVLKCPLYVNAVEARRELGDYFRFYNDLRPHQALGYRTPAEVFHGEQDVRSEESKGFRLLVADKAYVVYSWYFPSLVVLFLGLLP